jgi:hypothetical protein
MAAHKQQDKGRVPHGQEIGTARGGEGSKDQEDSPNAFVFLE